VIFSAPSLSSPGCRGPRGPKSFAFNST
jgi:hypothetical protein